MHNHTSVKPRVYTAARRKLHPQYTPADDAPDVLPYRREPIPITWFARLHNARAEGNYSLARRCVRELRTLGYSIVPIGTPKTKGGA